MNEYFGFCFELNFELNHFRPNSMKKWIFKTYRSGLEYEDHHLISEYEEHHLIFLFAWRVFRTGRWQRGNPTEPTGPDPWWSSPTIIDIIIIITNHYHHQDHHHHQWQKPMCILRRVALMNTKDHCWCCIVFSIAWLHQLQCLAAIWFATEDAAPQLKIWSSSPAEGNSWLQMPSSFCEGGVKPQSWIFYHFLPLEHGKKCKKVVPYRKAGAYWLREIWCWDDYILYFFSFALGIVFWKRLFFVNA